MEENNGRSPKIGDNFYLPPYLTYLSGPIAFASKEESTNWRNYVKRHLSHCIDPCETEINKNNIDEIVHMDLNDIEGCNFLLLYHDSSKPMVGTSMEAIFAFEQDPPRYVITVSDKEQMSPWMKYHSHAIIINDDLYKALDVAIDVIKKIQRHLDIMGSAIMSTNSQIYQILEPHRGARNV